MPLTRRPVIAAKLGWPAAGSPRWSPPHRGPITGARFHYFTTITRMQSDRLGRRLHGVAPFNVQTIRSDVVAVSTPSLASLTGGPSIAVSNRFCLPLELERCPPRGRRYPSSREALYEIPALRRWFFGWS